MIGLPPAWRAAPVVVLLGCGEPDRAEAPGAIAGEARSQTRGRKLRTRLGVSMENAAVSRPATEKAGRGAAPNKWVVLLTIVVMAFMSALDSSIVNVALPAMQRELSAGASEIQWVSSAYMLVSCAAVLVFGRLGDMYGKVRFFRFGVAVFTLGSLLCGLSATLPALVAARVVQGVGSAAALATNMGIATEAFPATERGRALGIITTFVSLGLMCGPTVGGLLVAVYPWESIFLINVPVGAVAFALTLKTLPKDACRAAGERLDVPGALFIFTAILLLFLGLTGVAEGVTPQVVALFAGSVALLAAFVAVELRAACPLVRVALFRNPSLSMNLVAMFLSFTAVGATEYLLPFFLQDACGYPSGVAGMVLTTMPAAMAVMSLVAGGLSDRIGCVPLCVLGCVVYALGIVLVGTLPATAGIPAIIGTMAIMSAGTGSFQSPNNSLVMGAVEREYLGFAGSMVSLARYLGMSAGVTGSTALLYGRMSALAGHTVQTVDAGGPELVLAGYSFTFIALAGLVVASLAFTLVAAAAKRRAHRAV